MKTFNVGDPCECPTVCSKATYLRCALTGQINPPKCEVCGHSANGELVRFNLDGSEQRHYHNACYERTK